MRARAVARLDKLARGCVPLLEPGGTLVAMKGRSAAEELAADRPALVRLGMVDAVVTEHGGDLLEEPVLTVDMRFEPKHRGSKVKPRGKGKPGGKVNPGSKGTKAGQAPKTGRPGGAVGAGRPDATAWPAPGGSFGAGRATPGCRSRGTGQSTLSIGPGDGPGRMAALGRLGGCFT